MTSKQLDHINEQELIRKYLDNSLTRDEELLVADLYESDKEFRDALDGLEMLTASEFTNSMTSINAKIDSKIRSSANVIDIAGDSAGTDNVHRMYTSRSSMQRLAIAASVVICLLVGGTFLMNLESPTERMVASNFDAKPYPDLITRGSGDDLSQPEKLAISAYNTENYEVSKKYFEELYLQYPENDKYGLFLGISHMGLDEHPRAVEILEELRLDAKNYAEDIDWYLALSYIKTKKVEKAKELLELLASNEDSYYSENSQKILKKLK